jgi:large subunit ribosomal protein L10
MLKHEKERVVAELAERLRAADTLFVADYRGLDVTAIDGVRTALLQHGARFSVVKNTLTKRAVEAAGLDDLDEFLEGPTAIAFVTEGDMVAVAKALNDTARETRILALKGGLLQGRRITADEVRSLASLPPADVLRGQVLGAVVGPLNAIVGLLAAPLRDVVGVIDARIAQLEEQGGAAPPPEEEGAAPAPSFEEARESEDKESEPAESEEG